MNYCIRTVQFIHPYIHTIINPLDILICISYFHLSIFQISGEDNYFISSCR